MRGEGGGENCTHASWKPLWWNFHLSFYMAGIRRRVCVLNYGRPCTWCTRLVENNVRGADCVLWSLLLFFNIYFSRSITLYFQIKSGVFHFAENVIRKFIGKRFFRVYYARRVCSRFNNVPIVIFEEIYVLNWKIYVFVGVVCVCVFLGSAHRRIYFEIYTYHTRSKQYDLRDSHVILIFQHLYDSHMFFVCARKIVFLNINIHVFYGCWENSYALLSNKIFLRIYFMPE